MLDELQESDIVIVKELTRISRSTSAMLELEMKDFHLTLQKVFIIVLIFRFNYKY